MKVAPLWHALKAAGDFAPVLIHTGQHYDNAMNCQFFDALGIPRPDIDLEVGSGSHAVQTAEVMRRFEPALDAAFVTAARAHVGFIYLTDDGALSLIEYPDAVGTACYFRSRVVYFLPPRILPMPERSVFQTIHR